MTQYSLLTPTIPYNVFRSLAQARKHLLMGDENRWLEEVVEHSLVRDPEERIVKRYFYPCPPSCMDELGSFVAEPMGEALQLLELWRLYGKYLSLMRFKNYGKTEADRRRKETAEREIRKLTDHVVCGARTIFRTSPGLVKKTLLSSDEAVEAAASFSLKKTASGDYVWRWCDFPPELSSNSPLSLKDRCKLWDMYAKYVRNCHAVARARQLDFEFDMRMLIIIDKVDEEIDAIRQEMAAELTWSTSLERVGNFFRALPNRLYYFFATAI